MPFIERRRLEIEKVYNCAYPLRLDKTLLRAFEYAHYFERTLSKLLWFCGFEENEVAGYYFWEENFDTDELWNLLSILANAIEEASQLDKKLEGELEVLFIQLHELMPAIEDSLEKWSKYREWWRNNSQTWIDKLNNLALQYRGMPLDKEFNKEEIELLDQYRYANKLVTDCLNSGCNVSAEVRQEIEETLFLPIAEIERRKVESNSTSSS
ncbi:MAG TPA: hypothetical protein VIQ31_26285 [Phormidium sp.]